MKQSFATTAAIFMALAVLNQGAPVTKDASKTKVPTEPHQHQQTIGKPKQNVLEAPQHPITNDLPAYDSVASSNEAADGGNKFTAGEAVKLVQQQQQQQQQHLPTDAEASHAQSPSHLASLPAEFAELEDQEEQEHQLLDDVDLSPRSVAEYLLVTGNWKVLEDALTDLVNSQLMTEEEAQNYYDDVNWEYEHALLSSTAETKGNGQQVETSAADHQARNEITNAVDQSKDENHLNDLLSHMISDEKAEAERADQQQTDPELELEQLSQPNTGNQGEPVQAVKQV